MTPKKPGLKINQELTQTNRDFTLHGIQTLLNWSWELTKQTNKKKTNPTPNNKKSSITTNCGEVEG